MGRLGLGLVLALQLLRSGQAQCTFDEQDCQVTCGAVTYDLSSYANMPTIGYFEVTEKTGQLAYYYYGVCAAPASSAVTCPNPSRRRRLQSAGAPVAIQSYGQPCPDSGPCTLSDDCATLGVFDAASRTCTANGTAGLICSYSGGSGGRSVDFEFACMANEQAASVNQVSGYHIILPGPAGCGKTGGGDAGQKGLSWGSLFLILLFCVALPVYLGGGLAYNVKVNEMDLGVEAIPQLEYWKQLPGLVKDGLLFSYAQSKRAYILIRDRNKDPALTASLKTGQDDDLAAALGS